MSCVNPGFNPAFNDLELPPNGEGARTASPAKPRSVSSTATPNKNSGPAANQRTRGRVEIQRQTAHRGGKKVTVISGFVGIGLPEKERLAKSIQQACGTGGTVKEGRIEIQGDRREVAARILSEAGFSPVLTGG